MVHNLNLLERASIFFRIDKTIYTTFLTSNASEDLTSWIQNFIKNSFCSKFWCADNVPSLRWYYLNPLLYLSLFLLFFFYFFRTKNFSDNCIPLQDKTINLYARNTTSEDRVTWGVIAQWKSSASPGYLFIYLFVDLIEQNIFGIFVIFVPKNFSPLFSSD